MIAIKMKLTFQTVGLAAGIIFLSACENRVSNSGVSVDTNAYYSVFQKSLNDDWRVILRNNRAFLPKTVTFSLDEDTSAYGLVFVCPSNKIDQPHEVFIYYSTGAEMELVDFICRVSLEGLPTKSLYGNLKGVAIADEQNASGEFVRLALLDETLVAWEAYAMRIRAGKRDLVAFKGQEVAGGIVQGRFLIHRNINMSDLEAPSVVDLDFDRPGTAVFASDFSVGARSTVNIGRIDTAAEIQTDIAFFTQNDTKINLVSSAESNFTFLPVPLEELAEDARITAGSPGFLPGESHALLLTAKASDGSELSRVSKFFTVSDGVTHNIDLLKPISTAPQLSSKLTNDLQSVILKWDRYQDDVSGKANFYQWTIEGVAANYLSDKVPTTVVDRVKWHVTVTAGWLDAVGATGNDYTLVLPTHFEIGSYNGPIEKTNSWRKEWGFRPGSQINWKMSAIVINDSGTAGDVIDYMVNRKLSGNLKFSEVHTQSK